MQDYSTSNTLNVSSIRDFFLLIGHIENEPEFIRAIGQAAKKIRYASVNDIDVNELHRLNSQGHGIYFVANGQGDTDVEIKECRALFAEIDDANLSEDEQVQRFLDIGLPEPTIKVSTGGKSIHCYWVLTEAVNPVDWRSLMADIAATADSDPNLKNPSRLMRLPGFKHQKTGNETRIIEGSGARYTFEELRAIVPHTEQGKKTAKNASRTRGNNSTNTITLEEAHNALKEHKRVCKRSLDARVRAKISRITTTKPGSRFDALRSSAYGLGRLAVSSGYDIDKVLEAVIEAVVNDWNNPGKDINVATDCFCAGVIHELENTQDTKQRAKAHVESLYNVPPTKVINKRYMNAYDVDTQTKLRFIKAPKGTGKSFATKTTATLSKNRVLVIGHRVALLKELAKKYNVQSYKEGFDKKTKRLAITLDSLWRLDREGFSLSDWEGADIIIDEISQVLEHLTMGKTEIKKRRHEISEIFAALLKNAGSITAMDADVSRIEIETLEQITGEKAGVVINEFKYNQARKAVVYDSKESLLSFVLHSLDSGLSCYIATSEKKKTMGIEEALKHRRPTLRLLSIHGDNSDDPEQKDFLKDATNNSPDNF